MAQQRPSVYDANHPDSEARFSELQDLLVGEYVQRQHEDHERIEKLEAVDPYSSLAVARSLAQAAKGEPRIRKALFPVIEDALRISVEENPSMMAGILFPIIGEAVRKAVAAAMQQAMDQTNSLLANSFSAERIQWRIEAWRNKKSFAEVVLSHTLTYRVEHVYLIHRTTGLLLGQVTKQDNLLQDSDMVVGMLTAIQDFVRDSFTTNKQADLDVIQVGEFNILLLHGPIALLAAVISGQPKASLRGVLGRQIEEIHKNYQVGMAEFETTGQSIAGIESDLKESLIEEAVETKEKQEQSYLKFKIAGVILLAMICAISVFYFRRALIWDHYIERLRHEPGIVVIDESQGWRTLSVVGLRDPAAMEPESILRKDDLPLTEFSEHWEPYYSLDPRFANVRRLNAEADALRKVAVRFPVDSTTLPLEQLSLLDSIGDQIQELAADANQQRRSLHIRVFGHTDSSGSSDHNNVLSQDRAESVVRFLVGRGIRANLFSAAGMRDTQPGYSQYIPEGQDLDRRVTFAVDLR